MNYPPPQNGPYPPQYLPQPHQHPQQPIQSPQFLYNNINPAQVPYQYGKPVIYPQVMLQNFNAYAQAYNQQHHPQQLQPSPQPQQQQRPPPPQPEPQPQYVNPADLMQQATVSSIASQFTTGGTSQYVPQPAVSVANHNTNDNNANRSSVMPTVSGSSQSSLYPASNISPVNNNAFGQYPQVAPKPPPSPMQAKPTLPPAPKPTLGPGPSPPLAAASAPPAVSSTPKSSSTPAVAPPSVHINSTPIAPTPTPRPVPQVLIPAHSPETQQNMKQQQNPKGQGQRKGGQQSARKSGKPPMDYQVLLLSLADDYINAAHSHGTMVALQRQEMNVEEYYKLLATGLGCLEAVLKVRRFLLFALPVC